MFTQKEQRHDRRDQITHKHLSEWSREARQFYALFHDCNDPREHAHQQQIATIAVAAFDEITGMVGTTSEHSRDAALTAIGDYVNQVFDKIDRVAAPQFEI